MSQLSDMPCTETLSPESALATAFFESAAEPVLLCDPAWRILAINQAAAGMFAVEADQIVGLPVDQVLARCTVEGEQIPAADSGRLEWRCRLRTPGCERKLLDVSGLLLRHRHNGVRGWALTFRDSGQVQEPPDFVGKSAVAQELLEFVARIAASRATSILLAGESGTGKELIAKRLHCLSRRSGQQFVPVNCATIPENLLETELFGYEKGAFTDARETTKGLLEIAHGGTLFLDEIGELSLPLQAKLLRVLGDHTFRRVGGSSSISVDVRVIGATNIDLARAIEERRFRGDLYYRLNVVQIRLPPLRERPDDIEELALHFLDQFSRIHHRSIRGIHPVAQRLLDSHSWPGNVRELRNVLERAVLVENSHLITAGSLAISNHTAGLAASAANHKPGASPALLSLRNSEQELIAAALAQTSGNQTRAAALLGIGRFSLRYRMKKLGMC